MDIKIFFADFESVEKVAKTIMWKKLSAQKWYDINIKYFKTIFFISTFCKL
jgi:hypothetical protein